MRGLIFTTLLDMIEESKGINTVNEILNICHFSHEGAYTSGANYPDIEIETLLKAIQEVANIDREDALDAFGTYMFSQLKVKFHALIDPFSDAKNLLLNVDSVIHHEIEKLYPQNSFVVFEYENITSDSLNMIYKSERNLCSLAIGLINGVANHFETRIDIKHDRCMQLGFEKCHIELRFHDDR